MSPMSPESVPSAMPRPPPVVEEEEWTQDSEDEVEVWSGPSNEEGDKIDEIDTNDNEKEATNNGEDIVEEPKVGMTFDTSDGTYLYYSRYAKEKRFVVATSNPVKLRLKKIDTKT